VQAIIDEMQALKVKPAAKKGAKVEEKSDVATERVS
jgi:hypothetical protein